MRSTGRQGAKKINKSRSSNAAMVSSPPAGVTMSEGGGSSGGSGGGSGGVTSGGILRDHHQSRLFHSEEGTQPTMGNTAHGPPQRAHPYNDILQPATEPKMKFRIAGLVSIEHYSMYSSTRLRSRGSAVSFKTTIEPLKLMFDCENDQADSVRKSLNPQRRMTIGSDTMVDMYDLNYVSALLTIGTASVAVQGPGIQAARGEAFKVITLGSLDLDSLCLHLTADQSTHGVLLTWARLKLHWRQDATHLYDFFRSLGKSLRQQQGLIKVAPKPPKPLVIPSFSLTVVLRDIKLIYETNAFLQVQYFNEETAVSIRRMRISSTLAFNGFVCRHGLLFVDKVFIFV